MPWHTILLVLAPTLLSVGIVYHARQALVGNWLLVGVAFALSFLQARPEVQDAYAIFGRTSDGAFAHGFPFFAALYWVFGRFELPSVSITWAGTYLLLLVTDIFFCYFQWRIGSLDLVTLLYGMGGAGWRDGLIGQPVLAVVGTMVLRHRLKHEKSVLGMIGQRRYAQFR
jgi:hypothetical protein